MLDSKPHEQNHRRAFEERPLTLRVRPAFDMTPDQFLVFCAQNGDLRIERTADGDIIIMPPAGWKTSHGNVRLTTQLCNWADQEGSGVVTDGTGGYILPNGAIRGPDAAWVRKDRLATIKQQEKFLPLCPDFVVELRSPSDPIRMVKEKMDEYMRNGAQLGWLIDPQQRCVFVYRPGVEVARLDEPTKVSGDPLLPGFTLDLIAIWDPSTSSG